MIAQIVVFLCKTDVQRRKIWHFVWLKLRKSFANGNPMNIISHLDFNCGNGDCVPLSNVCNGRYDCSDSSDEIDCSPFILSGYNKHLPPPIHGQGLVYITFMEIILVEIQVRGVIRVPTLITFWQCQENLYLVHVSVFTLIGTVMRKIY